MRRLLVAACLAFCLLASSACAANPAPASYIYADAMLRSAVADADGWWVSISGRRPPALSLYIYDRDSEAAAYANAAGGVWVARSERDSWWNTATNRLVPRPDRLNMLARVWGVMAHERGHNLGLAHGSGVMGDGSVERVLPGRAFDWAHRMLPARTLTAPRRLRIMVSTSGRQ